MDRQASILILDSQETFGFGIQSLIKGFASDRVTAVVSNYQDVLEQLEWNHSVNLAILDLSSLGVKGRPTIGALHNKFPQLGILIVSARFSREMIFECLMQGALGCVLKSQSGSEIANAIQIVLSGEIYAPASVISRLPQPDEIPDQQSAMQTGGYNREIGIPAGSISTIAGKLPKQQKAVLRLLVKGLSNKAIARELNLAEGTVKVHVSGVFKALNVNSRVQAAIVLIEHDEGKRQLRLKGTVRRTIHLDDKAVTFPD